jgi:hypothetical protein
MTRPISSKTQANILVALGLCLAALLIYQYSSRFFSRPAEQEKISRQTQLAAAAKDDGARSTSAANSDVDAAVQRLAEFQVTQLTSDKPAVSEIGRNLFNDASAEASFQQNVRPRQPAIELMTLAPASACVSAQPLKLSAQGEKFNAKQRIYINGEALATTLISSQELQATLPAALLATAQSLRVEVKELGKEAERFSNPLTFTINPPPAPPFVFIGEISDSGGGNPEVILTNNQDQFSTHIGAVVQNRWRILGIAGEYLQLEDVQLGRQLRLKKGEATAPPPARSGESAGRAATNEPERANGQDRSSGLSPELFARPAHPMTREELLQKRAAALKK